MSNSQQAEIFAAHLNKLRNDYLAHLPDEIDALRALALQMAEHGVSPLSVDELHHRLHKLAGSGGTFGLPELSQQASLLERQVKGWLESAEVNESELSGFVASIAVLNGTIGQAEKTVNYVQQKGCDLPGDTITVWLVDDDLLLGQEVGRQLESFNYEVRLFSSLGEADEAAQTSAPDILLLDVLFEAESNNATEVLSLYEHLYGLLCPLIFISSYDDFESRVNASKLNAKGYFLKPLNVPRLVNRISHLIDQRRAPPAKVMIVDDDIELTEHFRLTLMAAGMRVSVLDKPRQLMAHIAEFRPELILMDMHMPDFSGPELAGVIRQYENWASLPIVYLSAETDLGKQIAAMDRGADDFLIKPISDAQLVAAVRVRVERSRQLEAQISRDSLTGLLKHASIKEAVDTEVLRARRNEKPTTVVMLDIDHFKTVNDRYGHATGDIVISSIAMLLRQRLRQSDILGRYGGEEFVVVLPDCDQLHAKQLMEEVREGFARLQFNHSGSTFSCTLSAGMAETSKHGSSDGEALLILADEALYAAKRGGRNQIREAV